MTWGRAWCSLGLLVAGCWLGAGAGAQGLPQSAPPVAAPVKPGCSDIALPRQALAPKPALAVPRPGVPPAPVGLPASAAAKGAGAATGAGATAAASVPAGGQLAQLCRQYRAQCGKEHPVCA